MGREEVYIGTKIVAAEPMDELQFLRNHKGQDLGNRENRHGYKVRYEDGYVSWSPADVFERCYRRVTHLEGGLILSTAAKAPAAMGQG